MKNKIAISVFCIVSILIVLHAIAGCQLNSAVRIGTFDSRAVAIAYMNSDLHRKYIQGLRDELEKARSANDEKRAKEIEAEGEAQLHLAHLQGFSTGPVNNILEKIKDALPKIARDAGVTLIVSKWHLIYTGATIETVDVTDQLVKQFHTSEEGLRWIKDLKDHSPIPMEQLPAEPME